MTKQDDEDDKKVLKDHERLRVPLQFMDLVQRSIYEAQHSRSWTMDSNTARGHRPGYRVGQKQLTDSETRETLADAYAEYEDRLVNAYKTASPEPPNTPVAPVIDEGFDDEGSDCYSQYDARIREAWRSK